jgi:hypothetical protein
MPKRKSRSVPTPAPSAVPGDSFYPFPDAVVAEIKANVEGVRGTFYSDAEWAEINAAVVAVRGTPLSAPESASLLEAAWRYQRDRDARGNGTYLPPKARAKLWKKAADLCAQLCAAIEIAGRIRYGDKWRDQFLSFMRPGILPNPPYKRPTLMVSLGDVIEMLTQVGDCFARKTNPRFWRYTVLASSTGRLDPPIIYYQHVLWLWTDLFGGKLTFRRNAEGAPTGKLVRYFLAVTRPVMGGEAPSTASLPDIIDRQRGFYWLLDETWGDERAEIARNHLIVQMLGEHPLYMPENIAGLLLLDRELMLECDRRRTARRTDGGEEV